MSAPARRPPLAVTPLSAPLDAVVRVPGSKSITNRALVVAALAHGTSRLEGVLFADDTEAMLDGLARLGVELQVDRDAEVVTVTGTGGRVPPGPVELDARLSGTTSRFLLPLLALGEGPYRLDGAEPLRSRPMADGLHALAALGAEVVEHGAPGHLPVTLRGRGAGTLGGEVRLRGDVSSQFLSGLLLSAPCTAHGLTVRVDGVLVSRPYVELTASVMRAFGAEVDWVDDQTLRVASGGYRAETYRVEPDASAASYFFAAAAVVGGRVVVRDLHRSSQQGDIGFVDALAAMGATVEDTPLGLAVRRDDGLRGITTDFTHISDTAQTLAAVAAFADGPTTVEGIGFIRRKETDRIAAVVTELRRCGLEAVELDDGFRVVPGPVQPATIATYDDHRMAMSFALLGLRVRGIAIADPDVVAKTFPTFWTVLGSLPSGGNDRPTPAE